MLRSSAELMGDLPLRRYRKDHRISTMTGAWGVSLAMQKSPDWRRGGPTRHHSMCRNTIQRQTPVLRNLMHLNAKEGNALPVAPGMWKLPLSQGVRSKKGPAGGPCLCHTKARLDQEMGMSAPHPTSQGSPLLLQLHLEVGGAYRPFILQGPALWQV